MKKKLVAVALATIIAVMAVAGASLAWLQETTTPITNTFTEGKVDIELYEHIYDPTTQDLTATTTTSGVDNYKMVPGDVLPKDPTVAVVAGSEACWLFVKVEKINDVDTFLTYEIAAGWTKLSETSDANGNETVVIYRSVTAADASSGVSYSVLDDNKVTVNTTVEMSHMNNLTSSDKRPQLTFTAYAIQNANIADSNASGSAVDEAWALIH